MLELVSKGFVLCPWHHIRISYIDQQESVYPYQAISLKAQLGLDTRINFTSIAV